MQVSNNYLINSDLHFHLNTDHSFYIEKTVPELISGDLTKIIV